MVFGHKVAKKEKKKHKKQGGEENIWLRGV